MMPSAQKGQETGSHGIRLNEIWPQAPYANQAVRRVPARDFRARPARTQARRVRRNDNELGNGRATQPVRPETVKQKSEKPTESEGVHTAARTMEFRRNHPRGSVKLSAGQGSISPHLWWPPGGWRAGCGATLTPHGKGSVGGGLPIRGASAYIPRAGVPPAMAINGERNKPIGPGGGTRRLHHGSSTRPLPMASPAAGEGLSRTPQPTGRERDLSAFPRPAVAEGVWQGTGDPRRGRNRIDEGVKVRLLLGMVPPSSGHAIVANDNFAEVRLAA